MGDLSEKFPTGLQRQQAKKSSGNTLKKETLL
jgi:hypothetical protein